MFGNSAFGDKTFGEQSTSSTRLVRKVELQLFNSNLDPVGSLQGLKWVWFDQSTPDLFEAPVDSGFNVSTNELGVFSEDVPNSQLNSGEVGWLVITDSEGSLDNHKAFSGPVTTI